MTPNKAPVGETAGLTFKGTPGPWTVNGTYVEHQGGDVCRMSTKYGDDLTVANARLIAAAPELLKAAQALIEADDARSDVQELYDRACELARAALTKALTDTARGEA